jgi:hypothetical protein
LIFGIISSKKNSLTPFASREISPGITLLTD